MRTILQRALTHWDSDCGEEDMEVNPTVNHDMQETFRKTTVFYSLGNNLFDYFN